MAKGLLMTPKTLARVVGGCNEYVIPRATANRETYWIRVWIEEVEMAD